MCAHAEGGVAHSERVLSSNVQAAVYPLGRLAVVLSRVRLVT